MVQSSLTVHVGSGAFSRCAHTADLTRLSIPRWVPCAQTCRLWHVAVACLRSSNDSFGVPGSSCRLHPCALRCRPSTPATASPSRSPTAHPQPSHLLPVLRPGLPQRAAQQLREGRLGGLDRHLADHLGAGGQGQPGRDAGVGAVRGGGTHNVCEVLCTGFRPRQGAPRGSSGTRDKVADCTKYPNNYTLGLPHRQLLTRSPGLGAAAVTYGST